MPVEARISSIWKKQKLFVSLLFIGFGLYFFYDGAIGYPRKDERFNKHKEFTDRQDLEGWKQYAASRGWKEKPPEKYLGPGKYLEQYIFGSITTAIGLIALVYWFSQKNRRLRMDEDAVFTPSGTRVPFGDIVGIGKKQWDSKGIAKVRYEQSGRQREFIVDDYKFETEPTRQILDEIEKRLLARHPGAAATGGESSGDAA